MFESPDAICFPSPIQPPPTTLQYNPTPRNILFVHPWPGTLSFFHSVICSQPRLTYISSPKQSFWVVVGAGTPLGDQSLLHTAAIIFIWMQILLSSISCVHNTKCAVYNLAWWVQIMCTGLVASLVTGIPRRWGSKTIMSNDGNKTNRPLIINYSTVVCVLRNSFAMKWSCTLHPSKCNVVATAVGGPQVRCCR